MRANFPGEPGKLSTQEQAQLEAKARERRRFKTLKEYSDATGQDTHSVLVDYDVFVKVDAAGTGSADAVQAGGFRFPASPGLGRRRRRRAPDRRSTMISPAARRIWARTKSGDRCRTTDRGPSRVTFAAVLTLFIRGDAYRERASA